MTQSAGRSIRLFLADGTAHGLIVAEIINWTGKVLTAPRGRLQELLARPEAARTGLYILIGPDPDRSFGQRAYIGETDEIGKRLRYHVGTGKLDFFDRVAVIVSADDNLTKAHVRYLEAQMIRLATQTGSVSLANDRSPDFQRLPEADKVDMDAFIDHVRLILPTLGFDLFTSKATPSAHQVEDGAKPNFIFETAGASATAQEREDGFVVQAGSTARRSVTDTLPAGYKILRTQLISDGLLIGDDATEHLTFAQDVVFSSPSAAASIVAGRSASGPLEWKIKGSGQSYKDWIAGAEAE